MFGERKPMNPIHVDVNVSAASYSYQTVGHDLLITSIFETIQGEGPFAGRPAIFVRLAGCNYGGKGVKGPGCSFCDTYFSYADSTPVSIAELTTNLCDRVRRFTDDMVYEDDHPVLVVITGGEPMLQNQLIPFVQNLPSTFMVQIETNGTRLLPFPDVDPERLYIVWSPKVAEMANPVERKFENNGYAQPTDRIMERADCLKLLVSADERSPYHNIPAFAFDFAKDGKPVYLTPINVYQREPRPDEMPPHVWSGRSYFHGEKNLANHRRAAALAMRYGFTVSTQQHLMLGLE